MSQKKNNWKIEDLISTLKKHRDAVLIIGDKAVSELNLYPIDEASKKMLNRKKMVKEPKYFWEHYKKSLLDQKIEYSVIEKEIEKLLRTNVVKTAVNLNYTGGIDNPSKLSPVLAPVKYQLIELKGNVDHYRCMSCGKEDYYTKEMLETSTALKCECNGKIAPSIVMFGEKYLEKHTKAIKDAIFIEKDGEVKLNTHCLIFIGVDFEEDYMHELIESFSAIKAQENNTEDPSFSVIITERDGVSVEYYQPEFATFDDMAESIARLKDLIEK